MNTCRICVVESSAITSGITAKGSLDWAPGSAREGPGREGVQWLQLPYGPKANSGCLIKHYLYMQTVRESLFHAVFQFYSMSTARHALQGFRHGCVCVHTCLSVCLQVSMASLALTDWGKGLSKGCKHALVTANHGSGRGRGSNINCSLLALGNRVGGLVD